jgi:thiamine biosynthesis lipoprotein
LKQKIFQKPILILAVAEVSRLENLISDWIPTTPISDVNNAGIKPIKVPQENLI